MPPADNSETTGRGSPPDPPSETARNGGANRSSSGGLDDWKKALREMAPYLDLGWRLAGAAAGPPLLGHFLVDAWAGTTPWGLLGGSLLGVATVVVQLRALRDEFGS
jgi:hypothetical protein